MLAEVAPFADMPHKDQDQGREFRKEWKRKRRASDPEYARTQNQKWRNKNPRQYILARVRVRCRDDGIPFNIDVDDIVIPERCPVFPEIVLKFSTGRGRPDCIPTIDRVIPALGYVKGNVRVISMRANRLKSDASEAELEAILNYIKEHTCPVR